MEKERRAVTLVFFTLAMYVFGIFVDRGAFLIPFPLFDFVLIGLVFPFGVWAFQRDGWKVSFRWFLLLMYTVSRLLNNQVFWEFALDEVAFNNLLQSDWNLKFKIGQAAALNLVFVHWSFQHKEKSKYILLITLLILSFLGLTFTFYFLAFWIVPIFMAYNFWIKQRLPFFYLWVTIAVFDLLTWLAMTLF
ncbi:MAG: hypothetical protein RL264_834 [Bacteroidota bacterium]|jgi:hypothetical protein